MARKSPHTLTACFFIAFRVLLLCMLLLCMLSASALSATVFGKAGQSAAVHLNGEWAFAQTAWPAPEPDAAEMQKLNWQSVTVPGILNAQPDKGTVGLYRTVFDYPHDPFDKQLDVALYISDIRHADRVWLNRQQIGATGTLVPPWHFQVNNPQSLPRLYGIPNDLLRDEGNELIVEVSLGFGDALAAIYPGGTGITQGQVLVGNRDSLTSVHSTGKLQNIAIDTVFVVLGIIDAVLITFLLKYALNRFPGYLWLVINSLMMMVASGAQDVFFVFNFGALGSNSSFIIIILMLPLVNALFFRASRKDIPVQWVYGFSAVSVLITVAIIIPHERADIKQKAWMLYMFFSVMFYAYAIYAATDNFFRKRTGAGLQLFGLLFYLLSIRSQWLPDGLFDHRNIQIGTMVFRYFLFFSYIRQFMEIKKGYNASVQKILSIDRITRNAIAMELHDGVIQRLASIRLLSQLLKKDPVTQSETQTRHLESLTSEVDSAIATIRSTMEHSHDRCFENFSIHQVLEQDALRLRSIYQCTLTWELEDSLEKLSYPPQQWAHIYRIMHECVLNAIKHGGAGCIHLAGRAKDNLVVFTVENDGTPFTLEDTLRPSGFGSGHGWTAIRERVTLLNAEISVYSSIRKNTVVELRCPVTKRLSDSRQMHRSFSSPTE